MQANFHINIKILLFIMLQCKMFHNEQLNGKNLDIWCYFCNNFFQILKVRYFQNTSYANGKQCIFRKLDIRAFIIHKSQSLNVLQTYWNFGSNVGDLKYLFWHWKFIGHFHKLEGSFQHFQLNIWIQHHLKE